MGHRETDQLGTEIGKVEHGKPRDSSLLDDIAPPVKCAGADDLAPHDKDQADVVHPLVDAGEEVVAKLGAVGETHEERGDGQDSDEDGPGELDPRVDAQCCDHIKHDKRRAEAEDHEREEEQDSPKVRAGHVQDCLGEGEEAKHKSAQGIALPGPSPEISNTAKRRKCSKVFKKNVTAANEQSIHHRVGVLRVVGGIRGKVAEPNPGREKDLSNGRLPDGAGPQLVASPGRPEQTNAFAGIFKGQ